MTGMKKRLTLERAFPYILLTSGALGLYASFVLTIHKIKILKDPSFIPDCNINPIFSCGSIMKTSQAEIFGMPNTLFGIVAFSVIITIGVGMLFGAKFSRWFWRFLNLGVLAGLASVVYLFFQGIYRINAICPYCALTWAVVIALTLYVTLWNLRQGFLPVPKRGQKVIKFLQTNHAGALIMIYVAIVVLLLNRFWYYFGR